MSTYNYKVLDKKNRTLKGTVEADKPEDAVSSLKKDGFTVISVEPATLLSKDIQIGSGGIKTKDITVMCSQLVAMLKAGVSIADALKMLSGSTSNKTLKRILNEVYNTVSKGESLARALSMHPKVFPSIMIHMVEAGEASGTLANSLERVGLQLEKSDKTSSQIKKAMIYPAALLVICVLVVIVMLMVVIPNYASMFKDLDTELPGITKAVMKMSDFIKAYWFILLPVIIGTIVGIKIFSSSERGRYFFGNLTLKIPLVNNLVVKSHSAQMARTMASLWAAGVSVTEGLSITSKIMNNVYFKDALAEAKLDVIGGADLATALDKTDMFPPMLVNMIKIGSEAGNVEEMLDKSATYYEGEVETAIDGLMAAMQPALILVMAGIVGVLIGACMAPMLTMYKSMGNL